ncbi:hypothetical protein JL720_3526 [Aureococcus anophagefferens]|nr:hypothetical protein JL720_3526 [Aureococcus anophagefferens]
MALRFVQPMRRHLLVALLACDAARGAVKDLGACVRLAERRKAEPHSEYLEKKWASLECHLMPSTPTQVFRANPNLGAADRMEMLERNGQKVPRFILQQECDEHQRELIKHDCLLQRFTHAGDFGGEIVDWEACAKKMAKPPKFRWEQLRCEELVQAKIAADDAADDDAWFESSRETKQRARKTASEAETRQRGEEKKARKTASEAETRQREEEKKRFRLSEAAKEREFRALARERGGTILEEIREEAVHLDGAYAKKIEGEAPWRVPQKGRTAAASRNG